MMEDCFIYFQKWKKRNWSFFCKLSLFLNYYDNDGKCVPSKTQKRLYSYICKKCKMVTFLDFEKAANEKTVIFSKERQVLVKARKKFPMKKLNDRKKKERVK